MFTITQITQNLHFRYQNHDQPQLVSVNVKRSSESSSSDVIWFYISKYCIYVP